MNDLTITEFSYAENINRASYLKFTRFAYMDWGNSYTLDLEGHHTHYTQIFTQM